MTELAGMGATLRPKVRSLAGVEPPLQRLTWNRVMGPSALTSFVASTRGGGQWLRTYRPEELFDDNGRPVD